MHTDQIRIDPAYREALRAVALDRVDAILARVDGRVAAWSRTTDTVHIAGPAGAPGFFVKRYYYASWRKRLRGAFRGTFFGMHRAQAEFRWLNVMRGLGISAVRPVAYGCRRTAHFVAACVLITEETPDARNLTTFAGEVLAGRLTAGRARRDALIRRLATQVSEMHAAGFAHGQLFWRNVLVRGGPAGEPEFFFLDADPPRRWPGRVALGGLRDLSALAASALPFTTRTERVRFIRAYFNAGKLTSAMKSQVREIERLAARWRRHESQRIKMNELFETWNQQLAVETERMRSAAHFGESAAPAGAAPGAAS